MKKIILATAIAAFSLVAAGANAQLAQAEFRTIRLAQDDLPKAADFYKNVFGLHEIQRAPTQIVLNLSSTDRAMPRFALAKRAAGAKPADDVAHIIFNVADMGKTIAKVPGAGGTVIRQPALSGIGNMVAMARDPGGNVVEIVAPAPGANKIN